MAVNKNHPDYPIYSEKFKALWDAYMDLRDREYAKYPEWHGWDHPADDVVRPAHRKLSADIKALQKEYAHLFTKED